MIEPDGGSLQVARYFGGAADRFDSFYDQRRGRLMRYIDRTFRSDMYIRWDLTFSRLSDLTGRTVLDVGCGSGLYSVAAAAHGAVRVLGIDPASGMLEIARRRAREAGLADRCEFRIGTFPESAPAEVFDAAIVMGVMDYIEEPVHFLAGLKGRVSGGAAVSFPSRHWFRTPVRRFRYRLKKCPVYFYDEDRIGRVVREAGFSGAEIEKIAGWGMDFFAWLKP